MSKLINAAFRVSAAAVLLASVSACATVVRGTNDKYRVESTPPGATVTTSHGFTCTTPCTMELPRKSEFDIKLALEGHKDFEMHIVSRFSGEGAVGMAGNVIVGGVIGVGVDAVTGAALDLKPNPLRVEMAPEGSAEASRIAPDAPVATGSE